MVPKHLTQAQIADILSRSAPEEFIGAAENEFLEFKGEPYNLESDDQKAELAKDITALANTLGGVIILGVRSEKLANYNADVAKEFRPIPRGLVAEAKYLDVARDWVYPSINAIRIIPLPYGTDSGKSLFAIEIPESVTVEKPFLMVKTTDSPGRKERRVMFGYAERFESRALPVIVQRLQQLLHSGITSEKYQSLLQAIDVRLQSLESAIAHRERTIKSKSLAEIVRSLKADLAKAALDGAFGGRPRFWLAAVPNESMTFPTLFSSATTPLVQTFENPPELRDAGFDFAMHKPSEIVLGARRRTMIPGYKLVQLSELGELIVMVLGDEDFIGWNVAPRPGYPIRINSFVLAEFVYTFTLFVKQLYGFAEPQPKTLKLCIGFEDADRDNKLPVLSYLEERPYVMHSEITDKVAAASTVALFVDVRFDESAERMAFRLRSELYRWFGFNDDQVPYSQETSEGRVVTKESLFKEQERFVKAREPN